MLTAPIDSDQDLRSAAMQHVKRLQELYGGLTAADLRAGFIWRGERIPLINPQRGIFKPQRMTFLLSIRTVFPKSGAKIWYDDQRRVQDQIYRGEEYVDYAFMGTNVDAPDNRWLREAWESQIPVIYFLGTSPGQYQAIVPSFIAGWDPQALTAKVAFALPGESSLAAREPDRRYALRMVQQRLHQASFRDAVIAAYGGRCALSGLPEPMLLDAAHIISDRNELLGQPIVPNGVPLSKVHHAAFDAHLIGIDPDYRVHVSRRLLVQNDGPILESLKALDNTHLHLPSRARDAPDRARLAQRYDEFRALAQ